VLLEELDELALLEALLVLDEELLEELPVIV